MIRYSLTSFCIYFSNSDNSDELWDSDKCVEKEKDNMGSWEFCNVGYSCEKKNARNVKKLLECFDVDFTERYGSEAGEINYMMWNVDDMGSYTGDYNLNEIYHIVNRVFNNTKIFYEYEVGNNTSDWYHRNEEIYDPETNNIYIGETDYCYGDGEVFGSTPYELIKEECEKTANDKNISIEWRDDYSGICPVGEPFIKLCREIYDNHGGMEGLGTRQEKKSIPEMEIRQDVIIRLINEAAYRGYIGIVEDLKSAFNCDYEASFVGNSEDNDDSYIENVINDLYAQFRGAKIELSGTQYEGRTERIEKIKVGEKLTLLREPDNIYDSNAIDVRWGNASMGHLPEETAEVLAGVMDEEIIDITAEAVEVVPLSQRSKKAKKGLLYVTLNFKKK